MIIVLGQTFVNKLPHVSCCHVCFTGAKQYVNEQYYMFKIAVEQQIEYYF